MVFEPVRCSCGCALIEDHISARPSAGKPSNRIAIATICPRCRKIREIRMAEFYKGKIKLYQVESLYRATRLNSYTEEELLTGKVAGFNVPTGYNPDAFHEDKGQEE